MWRLFGRLMRVTGRQLRHLIGAAIHPPTLLPENPTGLQLSFRCWLLGHEDLVRTTTGRLYLECMECGRQTPGWRTGKSRVGGEARSIGGARDAVDYARCASTPSNRAALKAA